MSTNKKNKTTDKLFTKLNSLLVTTVACLIYDGTVLNMVQICCKIIALICGLGIRSTLVYGNLKLNLKQMRHGINWKFYTKYGNISEHALYIDGGMFNPYKKKKTPPKSRPPPSQKPAHVFVDIESDQRPASGSAAAARPESQNNTV